ncbi:MAG: tubulin-like doman-containing protein [Thermoplasmata archaeon]
MRNIYSQISLIGLGGTGCNIISHILKDKELLNYIIIENDLKINMLAIDIADGDINELKDTYNEILKTLKNRGVSQDKVFLRTATIKFSSPDVLFDFLQKYPDYLKREGKEIKNYKPWIDTSIRIPNLAGGVGRLRGLAKAIYELNYYHFSELSNTIEEFLNRVSSSTIQPLILTIFGVGGGTGSGVIYELASHLKKKIGGGIPIVGLGILPSNNDDSLAKGPAPYETLHEFANIFDINKNPENPLSLMFFAPLQTAVTETKDGTLNSAKFQVDEVITNIFKMLSSFDLADLMADIGASQNLKEKFINMMGILKVRYPIEDYIAASYTYLEMLKILGEVLKEKINYFSNVNEYLNYNIKNILEEYRKYWISIGTKIENDDDLKKRVLEIVKRTGKYDSDLSQIMRTMQRYFTDEFINLYEPLITSLKFPEDSVENSTINMVIALVDFVKKMTTPDFDLKHLISLNQELQVAAGSARFTFRQNEIISQFIQLIDYMVDSITAWNNLYFLRYMSSELSFLVGTKNKDLSERLKIITEDMSVSLLKYMSSVISKPEDEIKMAPQYGGEFRKVRAKYEDYLRIMGAENEQISNLIRRKTEELESLKKELSKKGFGGRKNKQTLTNEIREIEANLSRQKAILNLKQAELAGMSDISKKVELISSYIEVTGSLWKNINKFIRLKQEYNTTISNAVKSTYFFEKVLDLSTQERLRIIAMILSGQEDKLKKTDTLKEVIDLPRLKDSLKGVMRVFGSPSFFGTVPKYRTDKIWAIVSTPIIWDQELEGDLRNQLATYTTVSASASVSVRPISPLESWTIEFMIIMAKVKSEDLDIYRTIVANVSNFAPEDLKLYKAYLGE